MSKRKWMLMTPERRAEFVAHMAAYDNDNLPDGAWFAVLENAAAAFFNEHKLRITPYEGAMLYVNLRASK